MKAQHEKGEIRLEMNFTPMVAHRYLQKQINDLCYTVKKEMDMNEKFREEFSKFQTFKFFTQDQLADIDSTMKKY